MSSALFRRKSISQIQADAALGLSDENQSDIGGEGGGLRRTLSVFDLTMMGVAAIVGAGIFAMVGKASYNGGPAVSLLFVFTAFACGFSALCYAEFASRIPVAGSAYTYAYASMGEFIAWIIGWDLIVEYAIGNIAVAISWSDYFTGLLKGYGINVPLHFTMDFLTAKRGYAAVMESVAGGASAEALSAGCAVTDAAVSCSQFDGYLAWLNAPTIGGIPIVADLPALLIVVLITILVYVGIRESKFASTTLTILKLGIILLVIFLGLNYVNPENWSPFAPNGVDGVLKGVAAVFFAYIGFDALSTTAEECKNPRRDLPIAIILSLVICTILYIAIALVLTGMVSYTKLDVGDPLAFVFGPEGVNLPWVSGIIAVSAVVALATVFLVFQIGQPRIWMSMSRDGLLPKIFSSIHPKFKTPWFATIITGLVVGIPALFMNLTEVTDLTSIGTLFAFVVVCAGVLFKDAEFRDSGTRYVPYISAQIFLPIILIVVVWASVLFTGMSIVNAESVPNRETVTISTDTHSRVESENPNAVGLVDAIGDSRVYSAAFRSMAGFFSLNTTTRTTKVEITSPSMKKVMSFDEKKSLNLISNGTETTYDLSGSEQVVEVPTANGLETYKFGIAEETESAFSAFSHKIPMLVFLIVAAALLFFSLTKKFSLIPVLGLLSCLYLMTELGITNWLRFGLWLLAGLVIYALYGFRHSRLGARIEEEA